jgi:hypothetical protein
MGKGWFIVAIVEILALAIGVALYYFGFIAWYLAPLFLLIPPAILVIAVIAAFTASARNGGNPFQ